MRMVGFLSLSLFIGTDMPSWLDFSDPDVTITPTVANTTCTITATDSGLLTVNTSFSILFIANSLPTVVSASGSVSIEATVAYSHTIDLTTVFSDTDTNQTLSYTFSGVPGYLSSNLNSSNVLSLSGTPSGTDVGLSTIVLNATDG